MAGKVDKESKKKKVRWFASEGAGMRQLSARVNHLSCARASRCRVLHTLAHGYEIIYQSNAYLNLGTPHQRVGAPACVGRRHTVARL